MVSAFIATLCYVLFFVVAEFMFSKPVSTLIKSPKLLKPST